MPLPDYFWDMTTLHKVEWAVGIVLTPVVVMLGKAGIGTLLD